MKFVITGKYSILTQVGHLQRRHSAPRQQPKQTPINDDVQ